MSNASNDDALLEALGASQRLGFLGAAPLPSILAHAREFVRAIPVEAELILDVGSGGGVPGLVVAWDRPSAQVVLIDRRETRLDAVRRWVHRLGLADRVTVVVGDATHAARDPRWRGQADAVTARGLGAPGVTAELCRGFVRDGGVLLVSEPPAEGYDRQSRWPDDGLARVGWAWSIAESPSIARLVAVGPPADRIPRRRSTPPLF